MAEVDPETEFSFDDIKIHSAEVVDKPVHDSPYAKPVEIIVETAAWNHMNRHACEDLRHEAGGVMLGGIYEHDGNLVVRITTAVAARDAVTNPASIQFTVDAWTQMEKERQQHAPDEKLLGWYHTHPGLTAFFSETDRFLHQHFFTQPWHVALVIDPVHGEYRFYRWDAGGVHEVKDFLLKVEEWPGPRPPLNAVLSTALRQAARQAEAGDAGAPAPLGPMIQKLAGSVGRGGAERPLSDLLSLIIGCAELSPETISEARRRIETDRPIDSPIRYVDLEMSSNNSDPEGAISVGQRWLVQQKDRQTLHVHSLDETQPLCLELPIRLPVHDLTVNDSAAILLLTRGERPLYRIDPSLDRLRRRRRGGERQTVTIVEVEIDWRGRTMPNKIGKLIAAHHDLYLLAKAELWVLGNTDSGEVPRFECLSVHQSTECGGLDSFNELVDWTCDPIGNLYVLSEGRKEVWRFERLTSRWSRIVADDKLEEPRSLAAGMATLSVYDAARAPAIVNYSLYDGRYLGRRPLDQDVQRLRIWNLFSDGHQGLYLVTEGYVFQIR